MLEKEVSNSRNSYYFCRTPEIYMNSRNSYSILDIGTKYVILYIIIQLERVGVSLWKLM